jgi:uncharacterized SAM-binding protein YcdF (DUF218 family)
VPGGHSNKRYVAGFFLLVLLSALVGLATGLASFYKVCRAEARLAENPQSLLPADVSREEAIVVLTGDRYRIPKALELLHSRKSPLLIISGAAKGITLIELVNQQLEATVNIHEIWKKIVLESNSSSTIENALESAKIIKERGVQRIILVTSEFHMHRSAKIFHQVLVDLEVVEYPVASDFSHLGPSLSSHTLNGLWVFCVEYFKNLLFTFYSSHYVLPQP